MKFLTLIFCLFAFGASSQFTIQRYTRHDANWGENHFPIFQSAGNAIAAKSINEYLHQEVLGIDFVVGDKNRFREVLPDPELEEGGTHFRYIVHANNKKFVSVRIQYYTKSSMYSGTLIEADYNFDSQSGEYLGVTDFFSDSDLMKLGQMINDNCIEEIQSFLSETDSSDWEGQVQHKGYGECLEDYKKNGFTPYFFHLTDDELIIYREKCLLRVYLAHDVLGEHTEHFTHEKVAKLYNDYAKGLFFGKDETHFQIEEYSPKDGFDEVSIFPIVKSKTNPQAAERINDFLHISVLEKVFLDNDDNRLEKVIPPEGEIWGSSNFEYEVITNNDEVFCIAISSVYTGAYSEGHTRYYNFLARTGEYLNAFDLFEDENYGEVLSIVSTSCYDQIETYLSELDTTTEEGAAQQYMYEDCLSLYREDDYLYATSFYITDSSIVFRRPRCSSHAEMALDDLWEFDIELDFELLSMFLNDNGMSIINGDHWDYSLTHFPQEKVMYGSISKYPITMVITKSYLSGIVSGTYWYDSQNIPIELKGTIDSQGVIELSEVIEGVEKKAMLGTFNEGVFTGEWLRTKSPPNWKVKMSL